MESAVMMSADAAKTEMYHRQSARWQWAEEGRVAGAEALGAALLVVLSVVGGGGALAAGGAVCLLVQCLDHVSGAHYNPTVTLAAAAWGRVRWPRAVCMFAAQLGGVTLGAAVLRVFVPLQEAMTRVPSHVAPWTACGAEALGGACVALANCASWDPRNTHLRDSWPLRIGTTVAALTHALSEISGASFNPARSFGPALVACDWDHHWVYWVGPLGGALVATVLYCAVWRPLRVDPAAPWSTHS